MERRPSCISGVCTWFHLHYLHVHPSHYSGKTKSISTVIRCSGSNGRGRTRHCACEWVHRVTGELGSSIVKYTLVIQNSFTEYQKEKKVQACRSCALNVCICKVDAEQESLIIPSFHGFTSFLVVPSFLRPVVLWRSRQWPWKAGQLVVLTSRVHFQSQLCIAIWLQSATSFPNEHFGCNVCMACCFCATCYPKKAVNTSPDEMVMSFKETLPWKS